MFISLAPTSTTVGKACHRCVCSTDLHSPAPQSCSHLHIIIKYRVLSFLSFLHCTTFFFYYFCLLFFVFLFSFCFLLLHGSAFAHLFTTYLPLRLSSLILFVLFTFPSILTESLPLGDLSGERHHSTFPLAHIPVRLFLFRLFSRTKISAP
jgi:hypothetical protein